MTEQVIIAIDGLSASGKGTLAKKIAHHFGYGYLDTGKLYRWVALKFLPKLTGKTLATMNEQEVDDWLLPIAEEIKNNFINGVFDDYMQELEKNKKDLSSDKISSLASQLSQRANLRSQLQQAQLAFAKTNTKGVVMDGRDIGTVIFPNATIKLFITASPEIRAERRYLELQSLGISASQAEILAELKRRDHNDSTRKVAPLKPANDAIMIDSSSLSAEELFIQSLAIIAGAKR